MTDKRTENPILKHVKVVLTFSKDILIMEKATNYANIGAKVLNYNTSGVDHVTI